jgi:hypothetical protein
MSNYQVRRDDRNQSGSTLVVSAVQSAAKNHPVMFSLNIFGLLLLFFAAGLAPSMQQLQASAAHCHRHRFSHPIFCNIGQAYEDDKPEASALNALNNARTQAFTAKAM